MQKTNPTSETAQAAALFGRIIALRWPIIILGVLFLGFAASNLPKLVKDTAADAFIDPDNPALVYRDKVKDIFGLSDPIVIALTTDDVDGIYAPAALSLVRQITEDIAALPNVDPERVTSLATESHILGTYDGMLVEGFLDSDKEIFKAPVGTVERGREVAAAISAFPLYQGSLVARDGSAGVIVAELLDEGASEQTYDAVEALLAAADVPDGIKVYFAGEGAVAGSLSRYVDQDAARLNPLAAVIITITLAIAFMSVRGAVLPNLIVLATVAGSLGLMALSGVRFYVITNGLIVNLIGIAAADSIHIFSQYYEEMRSRPNADKRDLVVRAMVEMWRPVTLTTLTTIAGFLALAFAADMPPIQFFGLFGALGVAIAWLYSITFLPAMMSVWPKKRLPRPFRANIQERSISDWSAKLTQGFGRFVLAHPKAILGCAAVLILAGAFGASKIVVNEARIENFKQTEPIYQADKAINAVMDGTHFLDVMVETEYPEDLYKPEYLRKIEALQSFLSGLPNVNGTRSIADYIKQMHRAVNEDRAEYYKIPDDQLLIAQLFFLYNASADPADFEEEVDYAYQNALVRAHVDDGSYLSNKVLVPAVDAYLQREFNGPGIKGTVTGRVNVDFHWIKNIAQSHIRGVILSLTAVLLMSMLVFRSVIGGLIAVTPVAMAVLVVYAVMGFGGIWLGVGTSMFAAIVIGLGIDFAIHSLDRIREIAAREGLGDDALLSLFPSTGRALLFNFFAIALGFGVLITSDVPPLVKFGTLVAAAVSSAFLASMAIVPALVKVLQPRFLLRMNGENDMQLAKSPSAFLGLCLVLTGGAIALGYALPAFAQDLSAVEVMKRVNARDDGDQVKRNFTMELTDRRGITRIEKTIAYRKYFGEEKRTIFFYTDPTNIRGTGFLTFDYPDPDKDDDQWLYLPALRKIRRISASDRGDYFLGTDFTYEEIKKEQKIELSDYSFSHQGTEVVDGVQTLIVEGVPVDEEASKELGYSRVVWRIDPDIWMSRQSDYYDRNGNHLKTIHLERVEKIDGIDTAMQMFVQNHKTGHSTRLTFSNVDYEADVSDALFQQSRLRRGR